MGDLGGLVRSVGDRDYGMSYFERGSLFSRLFMILVGSGTRCCEVR